MGLPTVAIIIGQHIRDIEEIFPDHIFESDKDEWTLADETGKLVVVPRRDCFQPEYDVAQDVLEIHLLDYSNHESFSSGLTFFGIEIFREIDGGGVITHLFDKSEEIIRCIRQVEELLKSVGLPYDAVQVHVASIPDA